MVPFGILSQQAVEKALKALLPVLVGSPPSNTRSVGELYRLLKAKGFSLPKDVEEALPTLSKYYTVTRYPDAANGPPWESVDRLEAERALETARRVVEHVRKFLNKAGSGGNAARRSWSEIPRHARESVGKLLKALEEQGIVVEKAFVFGSYARGDWLWESDVDLVVVSSSFMGMPYLERLEIIYRLQGRLSMTPWVEVIPLTPEELEEKTSSLTMLREAQEYWVEVPLGKARPPSL